MTAHGGNVDSVADFANASRSLGVKRRCKERPTTGRLARAVWAAELELRKRQSNFGEVGWKPRKRERGRVG